MQETVLITRTAPDFSWEEQSTSQSQPSDEHRALAHWLEQHKHIRPLSRCDIVEGTIQQVTDKEVIIELDYKFNSVLPITEFRGEPLPKEGDRIEVYVEKGEDRKGQVKLSRWKARMLRAWERIVQAYENNEVIEAEIVAKTRGGLVALCFGYECFLPGSQLDIQRVVDYDSFLGQRLPVKVVKINESIMNAVVSRKAVLIEERERRRQELMKQLEPGLILKGRVKSLAEFGAFIDLGGLDGVVYTGDITWRRIRSPKDVLTVGQEVEVVVLSFDPERNRIVLGMKQLQPNPWDVLPEDFQPGKRVRGKVTHIERYGAFVEVLPGVEGLIHVSEISWTKRNINPFEYFQVGQEVEAVIVSLDREARRMGLSIRRLEPDPWETIETRYPPGTRVKATVQELRPQGAFVELEDGIQGFISNSDLSWTRHISHPSQVLQEGQQIEAIVLDYDKRNRRLKLGYKQLQENPWPTFASIFSPGSVHTGTVLRIEGNEAFIELPYEVEARAYVRDLKKQNGEFAQPGETLDFIVTEFRAERRLIRVSHTKLWREAQKEAESRKKARRIFRRKEKQQPARREPTPRPAKVAADQPRLGDVISLESLQKLVQKEEENQQPAQQKDNNENPQETSS